MRGRALGGAVEAFGIYGLVAVLLALLYLGRGTIVGWMLGGASGGMTARLCADFLGVALLATVPNFLLNVLVGQKLSIVTPRPQTTRNRLIGLLQLPEAQIAFIDTPGLHLGQRRALNRAMNRTAAAALGDADLVLLVLEALRWTDEDDLALAR